MTTQKYRDASHRFLQQALAELDAGDLPQASEKGWGAAAQIVKAVAEQREWDHNGHGQLFAVVDRLRRETDNPDVRNLFDVASGLHSNFYENWRSAENIEGGISDIRRFVALVDAVIDNYVQ